MWGVAFAAPVAERDFGPVTVRSTRQIVAAKTTAIGRNFALRILATNGLDKAGATCCDTDLPWHRSCPDGDHRLPGPRV